MTGKKLSVLHIAPEAAPLAKVGGLADVTGSLPTALRSLEVDARLLIPAWGNMVNRLESSGVDLRQMEGSVEIPLGNRLYRGKLLLCHINGVPTYLLRQEELCKDPIYPEKLEEGTALPFAFLSYAGLALPALTGWSPDVYHCHDWTTAFLPIALRWHSWFKGQRTTRRSVFTVHNLAHQGLLEKTAVEPLRLPWEAFNVDGMEYFDRVNLLKGAINGADHVTTVSPTYAGEIQTPGGGHDLDGVLRNRRDRLSGILNGLDDGAWNPETDKSLPVPYSADDLSGKKKAKALLEKETGLTGKGPIAAMVSRLVEQKGLDILLPALGKIADMGLRIVVVGSGESRYEDWLTQLENRYGGKIKFVKGYHETLGRLAYGGSDIYLMPSRFEPCGLSQLIALRYGSIPVVRRVGGLADTVYENEEGIGFVFDSYDSSELLNAVGRAMDDMEDEKNWQTMVKRGMKKDFSWKASAPDYREIYRSIL
ncbi:MAG: glycogen synthase [Synergistota bacterium]|nr:glycogen synthase [Synergistota bacterium]